MHFDIYIKIFNSLTFIFDIEDILELEALIGILCSHAEGW